MVPRVVVGWLAWLLRGVVAATWGCAMRVYATFPFSEAINKQAGDYVALGGLAYKVTEVVRKGRNEPYFRLEGVAPDHWMCHDAPGLISWQVLGDARV